MKSTDFKKIIKEAVREAIQEELKDILLGKPGLVDRSLTEKFNFIKLLT